jgi:hypothetical protein
VANLAQMAVDKFWKSVMQLEQAGRDERAKMVATRQKLIVAAHEARTDPDPDRSKARMALLNPLIHENSVVRMRYRDLAAKFNSAVHGARGVLAKAGLTVPHDLSGLGQIETTAAVILVPVVAVAALGLGWEIYNTVKAQNQANTDAVDEAIRVSRDPSASPADVSAARSSIMRRAATPPPAHQGLFDVSSLVPLAAMVAAIVIVPPLLKRRSA